MGVGQTYDCEFVNTETSLIEHKTTLVMVDGDLSIFSKDTLYIKANDIMMTSFGETILIYDMSGNTYMYRKCELQGTTEEETPKKEE